jgi:hypothetical protein
MFSRDDFALLSDLLRAINGKFITSINDAPEFRKLFKGFKITEASTTCQIGGMSNPKKVTELVISNC